MARQWQHYSACLNTFNRVIDFSILRPYQDFNLDQYWDFLTVDTAALQNKDSLITIFKVQHAEY